MCSYSFATTMADAAGMMYSIYDTDTKLEELTREVREHNNFARRVPVLEEQIKVINHQIADLEHNTNN